MKVQKKLQKDLLAWFEKNKRDLPWREKKRAYNIWISEVMLQQTTSQAVIPYYKKFLKRFPTLKSLSQAQESEVLPLWQGLGYYSRARNLLKASRLLVKKSRFPRSYKELIQFPSFGPYTSRAVSSIAFDEPVGVLDGNMIRFLSRFYSRKLAHWQASDKAKLQELADAWVQGAPSSRINPALMELGSLICSQKPLCLLCPVRQGCLSLKQNKVMDFPLKKPRKKSQIIHWYPRLKRQAGKLAFIRNKTLPFFKDQPLFPGRFVVLNKKPQGYDFQHSIMNYKIYVTVQPGKILKSEKIIWIAEKQISKYNPSSLVQKVLQTSQN